MRLKSTAIDVVSFGAVSLAPSGTTASGYDGTDDDAWLCDALLDGTLVDGVGEDMVPVPKLAVDVRIGGCAWFLGSTSDSVLTNGRDRLNDWAPARDESGMADVPREGAGDWDAPCVLDGMASLTACVVDVRYAEDITWCGVLQYGTRCDVLQYGTWCDALQYGTW